MDKVEYADVSKRGYLIRIDGYSPPEPVAAPPLYIWPLLPAAVVTLLCFCAASVALIMVELPADDIVEFLLVAA